MFVTVQLLTGLLITTVISHVVGPLVQKETLPKITFRKIGPLVASSDSGYLISRIPLEQMIAKVRIHEMLSHQFKKVADEFNQTEKLAEFSLHGHQIVTQSQEMVYRMLILLSLMEDAGDRKLSLLDTYVSEHLALLIDLKRYVDQSGTFQSLVQGMVLSDEQFRRINAIDRQNPFFNPYNVGDLSQRSESGESSQSGEADQRLSPLRPVGSRQQGE